MVFIQGLLRGFEHAGGLLVIGLWCWLNATGHWYQYLISTFATRQVRIIGTTNTTPLGGGSGTDPNVVVVNTAFTDHFIPRPPPPLIQP